MYGDTHRADGQHMLVFVRISDVICALCLTGVLLSTPAVAQANPAPQRVVSMNLCTDQLAMLVAGEGQLLSVSYMASDPRSSAMVEAAQAYPANHGLAEEIYLMQPDLVIAGLYTTRATTEMLERLGIPVAVFDAAYSLEDVRDRLTQMGEVLAQKERAAGLVVEFDARLAAYQDEVRERPRAALYYANGYTSGDKTLAGQILATAGLSNIATEAGYDAGGILPLEVLAMAQPDAVITSSPYPGKSRSEEITAHPVIGALRQSRETAALTDNDWVCGTPFVLRAIDDMVQLRQNLQAGQP